MTTLITLTPDQVRAALDGRLGAIRIPLEPQPPEWCANDKAPGYSALTTKGHIEFRGNYIDEKGKDHGPGSKFIKLPHAVGDLLWCREQYCFDAQWDEIPIYECAEEIREVYDYNTLKYMADEAIMNEAVVAEFVSGQNRAASTMPKWASRLTLKVQRVRVERLQDITEAGAVACGFEGYYSPSHPDFGVTDGKLPTDEFKEFWDNTHTKPGQSVKDNPWVVVYGVEVIKQNVEELERQNHES